MQTASFRKSETNSRSGDTIPLFLDTNVIAGYCYAQIDKWGYAAEKVIASKRKKYTSQTVWREFFGEENGYNSISEKIIKELQRDINHCRMYILKGHTDLFTIPPRQNETENRLLRLLEPYKDEVTPERFLENSNRIIHSVQKYCRNKITTFEEQVEIKVCNCNHPDIYQNLQHACKKDDIEIDYDDFEIIMDAHTIGLQLGGITFVTGDYKHIVSAQEHITSLTAIKAICPLGSLNKQ